MDINRFTISGRCSRQPELKTTRQDKEYTFLHIATNKWDSKTKKELPTFIQVIVGGKLAGVICDRVGKGDQVVVEGHMRIKPGDKEKGTYDSISLSADNVIFGMAAARDKAADDVTADEEDVL